MNIDSHNPQIIEISPLQFQQLKEKPIVIDVRFRPEYQSGHAPNTHNLSLPRILMGNSPFFQWLLPQWFKKLKKDQPLAVICLTSHRSEIAAQQFVKKGFTHVYNITGGMMEWKKLGLEIKK